ncbi:MULTISPECIES: chemotaxis protein CheW [Methylophilus]|jgi:purine-binding chemotaxis protein CheW|uniref:Chemotaxis protein CheW n=1 Tax=Methylophilus luteus TaxID=640108 RepID=A0ABW3F329_9PROT
MTSTEMTNNHGANNAGSMRTAAGEYLTFVLGNEQYGIEILKVQEIRGYDAVTQIANMPPFIKGVINLRGKIVPIVDLRIKFKLGKVEYNEFTVVIILNLNGRIVGIVVDGVSDVRELREEHLREVPSLVTRIDTKYIVGLATIEQEMLILVDIEKLMTSNEMELMDAAVH